MKKIFILTLFIAISYSSFSQEDDEIKTIFTGKVTHVSGFGGPMMNFSTFDGNFAFFMGGGGGVLINHKFYFGGAGYGMTTPVKIPDNKINDLGLLNTGNYKLNFGYGGLMGGYIIGFKSPLHLNCSLIGGWGGISITEDNVFNDLYLPSDEVFVFVPCLELEMNLTKFFRIGIGANYRFVTDVNIASCRSYNFSSPSAMLNFKFGAF